MLFIKEFKLSGVVFRRLFQFAERRVDIREECVVTHRVYRIDIFSPHLFIAPRAVALLVVLLYYGAHIFNEAQFIYVVF